MRRRLALLVVVLGCRATTARPTFVAFPEAETAELGFGFINIPTTVGLLTDTLVTYLRRDSIPVTIVKRFDGYIDSGWFDSKTLKPTAGSYGDGVVRVRGFIDPAKPGFGRVNVETVYRPFADPSRPARELEAPVALGHPISARVVNILQKLKTKYGAPEDSTPKKKDGPPPKGAKPGTPAAKADSIAKAKAKTAVPPGAKADSAAKPDTTKVAPPKKPDTTATKRDTTVTKRDTSAVMR